MVNPHLFVYGTLMPSSPADYGRGKRERLVREARLLGPATMPGRLYDLGRYPGLVDGEEPTEIVHGEVVALLDPEASFPWLDAYEGILQGRHDASQYARLERTATLATGERLTANVYVYLWSLARARHLPDGRWAPAGC